MENTQIRQMYEQLAAQYDQFAALEREVADRLLERVSFQRREPARIVDLGCGTGYCAAALKRMYRKAEVVAVDFALPMCHLAADKSSFMRPLRVICADINNLPLASRSVDLLVANLSLQWTVKLDEVFSGFRRILRPNGLLLFSLPGTDSLREFRQASLAAGLIDQIAEFQDMHDIGDALLAAGFREPVMDAEHLTLTYPSREGLMKEFQALGSSSYCIDFSYIQKNEGLLANAYPLDPESGRWPLTWEIAYGAAFGPEEGQPVRSGGVETATFSVEALRGSRRNG